MNDYSNIIVDFAKKDNCWNKCEGYYNCVGCNCCSEDKEIRYKARIDLCIRQIEDNRNFDGWIDDPSMKAIQEKNVKLNIQYWKRRAMYYEKKLQELRSTTRRNAR